MFRKLLRILHRDLGYFIVGITIIYSVSGIFFNHRKDFHPDFTINFSEFQSDIKASAGEVNATMIKQALEKQDPDAVYRQHYVNSEGLIKVFLENGEAVIDPETGWTHLNYLERRPVIFEMNKLHKASIGSLWKWVSDILAVILLFVAISGLFLIKGNRGFLSWGWWLTLAGFIIPLGFVFSFL
jgi:uncharacterized protein